MLMRAWRHPVFRADLIGNLVRGVADAIVARMIPGPMAIPYANGTSLLCAPGRPEAAELRLLVLKDFDVMAFLAHFLRKGDHFIDVGAGIGSYTVLASGVAGARVTAFEPSGAEVTTLLRNVAYNELQCLVRCQHEGLGDVAARGRATLEPGGQLRVVLDPCAADEVAVAVRRLDDLSDIDRPRLLKVAAGGDELYVLRGAHATLERQGLEALIVATEKPGRGRAMRWHLVSALLEKHGFVPAEYDPFRRRLLSVESAGRKCLFVRERAVQSIEHRLQTASNFWAGTELCV